MLKYNLYFSFIIFTLACSKSEENKPKITEAREVAVEEGAKRHAVVIVIDTLRADALKSAHTPTIDSLAQKGGQAKKAWSSGSWTAPSVISLMIGKSLREHGWDFPMPAKMRQKGLSYPPMPTDSPTLAEVLSASDFTAIGHYANPLLRRELGFDRGFDSWSFTSDHRMERVLKKQLKDLYPEKERYFFYLHLIGPHHPLRPSGKAVLRWNVDKELLSKKRHGLSIKTLTVDDAYGVANYNRAYHAVIEDTDARLAGILEALQPILDDSVIVLTSDHGEMLGEHNQLGHHSWVYEPLVNVPFVVVNGEEVPENVNNAVTADIITSAVQVDHDWQVTLDQQRPLVSQREGKVAMSQDGRIKGIWDEKLSVFDLLTDPKEEIHLEDRAGELSLLRQDYEARIVEGIISDEAVESSSDMDEALRSLGYIE